MNQAKEKRQIGLGRGRSYQRVLIFNDHQSFRPQGEISREAQAWPEISPPVGRRND